MKEKEAKTAIIKLTRGQVRDAMERMIADVQADYPDETEALNVAEALGTIFERTLLKDQIIPRIPDCLELAWLHANGVPYSVKSSIDQFSVHYFLRIQILKEAHRKAWVKWRDN